MATNYICINQNMIDIYQGSDYEDTITFTYPEGTPYNLTGCSFKSQLRTAEGVLAGEFECSIQDAAWGVIKRHMNDTVTALLTPRVPHVWGVKVTAADGEVLPEIQGGANVIAGVVE